MIEQEQAMKENEYNNIESGLADDERIVRYLSGKMTKEESDAFYDEMKHNDELRENAVIQARLIKGMKQADEELLNAFKSVDLQDVEKIVGVRHKSYALRIIAIAASLVFVSLIGFKSYDYYETTNLGKEYANAFPVSTIIRGESNDDVDKELTALFEKVSKAEDLDNATSRLATLWELAKQETYNDYTDYAPYIGWYLAIGYLENYEKDKAKNVLEEMAEMYPKGTMIGDKVRNLIERI